MKKFLTILLMAIIVLVFIANDGLVNSKIRKGITQTPDQRYFDQLSKRYYGTTAFGRNLALINQSVSSRDKLTRHDIIVPSRDALVVLHQTCNVTVIPVKLADHGSGNPMPLLFN